MDTKQSQYFLSVMGERPERHQWVAGEIRVERYGRSNPYFLFRQNDRILARLEWPHPRRGNYVAEDNDIRFDLVVTHMGSKLVAKDQMSRISSLQVKHARTTHRAKMVICLSDSDQFLIQQRVDKANPRHVSLHITKEYYVSELFDIQFVGAQHHRHRGHKPFASRTIATVRINPVMRWEARHFHQLMALMVGRIVFVGGHDHFRFDMDHNQYFKEQGLSTVRRGRMIHRRPPRR